MYRCESARHNKNININYTSSELFITSHLIIDCDLLDYVPSKIIENIKTDLTLRTVTVVQDGWSDIHKLYKLTMNGRVKLKKLLH